MGRNAHWTHKECMRLMELAGDMPMDMLSRIWNGEATRHGWPKRSRMAIKERVNRLGMSVVPVGKWLSLGALSEMTGITQSALNQWVHAGLLSSQQRVRCGKHYVNRRDLRRLARQEPWKFGGCSADGLFLALEDRALADQIAAEYPFRPRARRGVRCLTLGKEWESSREAAAELHCEAGTIRKAIRGGHRCLGMDWEYVA